MMQLFTGVYKRDCMSQKFATTSVDGMPLMIKLTFLAKLRCLMPEGHFGRPACAGCIMRLQVHQADPDHEDDDAPTSEF